MRAWSRQDNADVLGPSVTRSSSPTSHPPLKNGNEMRESGYLIAVGSRTARFRRKHKNKMLTIVLLIMFLFILSLAVAMTVLYIKQKKNKPIRLCESKECLRSAANLATSMDKVADPCEDFYQYVCGNWATDHPRPDAYVSYDWFRDKQTKVYTMVREFLSKNVSGHPKPVQQAKYLYTACMDIDKMDKDGVKPMLNVLSMLGLPAMPTFLNLTDGTDYNTFSFDWLDVVIKIKTTIGMDVLIGFDIFTDPKNSSVYRLVMGSPETTNPFPSLNKESKNYAGKRSFKLQTQYGEESFYETFKFNPDILKANADDEEDAESKSEKLYRLYYAEIMKLIFLESGAQSTTTLTEAELDGNLLQTSNEYVSMFNAFYEIETSNETLEDELFDLYIPEYTVDEIQAHTDMIVESNNSTAAPIWKRYLEGIFGASDVKLDFEKDKILVSDLDLKYMSLMASLIATYSPVAIELYIWMQVVEVMAIHTTSELRALHQRYYNELHDRVGAAVPARSHQCASAVNDMLGMAVAYAIVDQKFIDVTKPKVQIMLNEMKNALSRLVGQAEWMDDNTKVATYEKIILMKSLIGFPDWLLDEGKLDEYYEGIAVNNDTYLDNLVNIVQVKAKKVLNKFREENNVTWATDPTEVNAYHTFQENTITVPLVMLQYPFYDLGLDSLNYGSLGTVLGHEITHGFDNFGRQFDKDGNFLPWWSNVTVDSFVNKTQCFVDQYSSFYVKDLDTHIDGKKTLGENIADNGGVREALGALHEHLHRYGPEEKLPGFEHMTSDQMFFLSYGNLWCGVATKESLKSELNDVHSPQSFRARGALQNNAEFAKAWKCPTGSTMNPTSRCIIF